MSDYPSDDPERTRAESWWRERVDSGDTQPANATGLDIDHIMSAWEMGREAGRADARANPAPQEPAERTAWLSPEQVDALVRWSEADTTGWGPAFNGAFAVALEVAERDLGSPATLPPTSADKPRMNLSDADRIVAAWKDCGPEPDHRNPSPSPEEP